MTGSARRVSSPRPRVSVVIPTFNRDWCIARAVDSVLAQTYRDLDLWVVDDGGSDTTGEIVRRRVECSADIVVHYVRTAHRGVAAARNTGVSMSSGEFTAFLDSDDEWLPEKLEKQIACLDNEPRAALVHCGEAWIRNDRSTVVPPAYRKYGGEVFKRCLPVCMIGPSTAVIRRSVFREVGGFDESFPVCEDYDLWLRVTVRRPVALVEEPLVVKYGGHPDQLSTTVPVPDEWRVRALCRILSAIGPEDSRRVDALSELRRRGALLAAGYRKHGRATERRALIDRVRMVDRRLSEAL